MSGAEKAGKNFKIALIAGDGIGPEVTAEARKAADAAASSDGAKLEWSAFPFGAAHYLSSGEILPKSSLSELAEFDALMLGAIGAPSVKPGILERGILLELRFAFDQYINLRPARSLPNVPTPVPLGGRVMDSVVIRENTEDLYMGLGGVSSSADGLFETRLDLKRGGYTLAGELKLSVSPGMSFAVQAALNTRHGVERITRYACETAGRRGETRVTIVTKSNAAPALYGYFEDTAKQVIDSEYPGIKYDVVNVDALCYHLVRDPLAYGVLLCPNLFGDIVSDLQAGLAGGLGTAAGGNIGDGLSMFEPVHGSAPDIAGTGRANPIAAVLSGALMLRHIGLENAALNVERAVGDYLEHSPRAELPFEFGGGAACSEVGGSILKKLQEGDNGEFRS
ncbi:MAG: isocitrate/isopropylmalate dehydrogenase family protein [Synergistaceae bacterium]|jgi:3-isopropylmalate dehydrogenase|nr:isocitrate/isopropylmalate dehydrogenase family protein [Synergistaceae bacterium]